MKIYLTRHGQTQWNVEKRLQGWKDSPLTDFGIKRAYELKDELEGVVFDYIYSSNQKRAYITAEILKGNNQTEIFKMEQLREIGFGLWEGKTLEEINEKFNAEYTNYLLSPLHYVPFGGETIEELFERVKDALSIIVEKGGDNILIVSHGVTIRALLAILNDFGIERFKDIPVFPGASLSIFELEDGNWRKILEGDTEHFQYMEEDFE